MKDVWGLVVVVCLLLMTACASAEPESSPPLVASTVVPEPTPSGVPATVSSTAQPSAAPTATPTPNPTSTQLQAPPAAVLPAGDLLDGAQRLVLPTEIHPDSLSIEETSDGLRMAVGGFKLVLLYDGSEEPLLTRPFGDEPPERGFVSHVAAFRGMFLAALGEGSDDSSLMPELVRWDDAAQMWRPLLVTVTTPASAPLATNHSVALTPPSPPWQGRAGILDMAVNGDTLWATGWATFDDQPQAVVWRTANGTDWQLEILPRIGTGVEYGATLHVGDQGMAVALGNWTHFGAGIVAREPTGSWFELPFPPDANGSPRLIANPGPGLWIGQDHLDGGAELHHFSGETLAEASDLARWTSRPFSAEPNDRVYGWSPAHEDGPILWLVDSDRNAIAVQDDGEEGAAARHLVPGRFVGSDQGWAVLQSTSEFILVKDR